MTFVRDVIKSFDNSDESGQLQKETVQALAALGDSKAEVFKMQIQQSLLSAGDGTNKTIPISSIVRQFSDVRAYSSSEAGNLGQVVKKTLNTFLNASKESIVDGIGSLISETLSVFLGTASASTGTVEEYYVAVEGLSVVRVDMRAWYLNVNAKSIQSKMERVVAVVGVKSVVDLAKIDFSTFLNLYQQQLIQSGNTPEERKAALEEVKRIYKDFKETVKESTAMVEYFVNTPPAARSIERERIMANIQNLRISDQQRQKLVGTANEGEYFHTPGHASQVLAFDVKLQDAQALQKGKLYSIAATNMPTTMNMQYDHEQVGSNGRVYVFIEVVREATLVNTITKEQPIEFDQVDVNLP